MQDLLGDLASGPAVAGPPPVAEDLSNVPGAQGPPREVHDTTNEPQEDVEVRCHARATTGKMPPSRYLHTANTVAERLIVYGGKGPHGPLGDVHVLDMKMSAWMQAKPTGDLPAPRFGHTSVAQGTSQLIVFGGMASGHSTFSFQPGTPKPAIPLPFASNQRGEAERHAECEDELYTLDLETFEWVQQTGAKGAVPSPRYKHSATPIPERKGRVRMFVFGGCDDEHVALNDQYSLDCETMEWSEVQTSGTTPSPRFGHSATWLPSRKILLLGGSNGAKSESEHGAPDPEIPPHKTTKSLLPMCAGACARVREATVASRALSSGDLRPRAARRSPGSVPRRAPRRGLNMLDIDTMTWSQPTARGAGTGAEPSPRCFHSAALCGKNLFVLGGQVHHWLLANNHYVHGTYILETTKLQWEHNTIKGDSFIPYPGASLLGHTGTAADSSSLYLGFGIVESTASHECARPQRRARAGLGGARAFARLPPRAFARLRAAAPAPRLVGCRARARRRHRCRRQQLRAHPRAPLARALRSSQVLAALLGHRDRCQAEAQPVAPAQTDAKRRVQHDV